jgi:hypothetical protein
MQKRVVSIRQLKSKGGTGFVSFLLVDITMAVVETPLRGQSHHCLQGRLITAVAKKEINVVMHTRR